MPLHFSKNGPSEKRVNDGLAHKHTKISLLASGDPSVQDGRYRDAAAPERAVEIFRRGIVAISQLFQEL